MPGPDYLKRTEHARFAQTKVKPENELHFLFQCEAYTNERTAWLSSLEKPEHFINLSTEEKLKLVLNLDKNVKKTAQFIIEIYDKRRKIVSNLPSINQDRNIVYHIFPHDQCPACNQGV
jgi:hypothetical protein